MFCLFVCFFFCFFFSFVCFFVVVFFFCFVLFCFSQKCNHSYFKFDLVKLNNKIFPHTVQC